MLSADLKGKQPAKGEGLMCQAHPDEHPVGNFLKRRAGAIVLNREKRELEIIKM